MNVDDAIEQLREAIKAEMYELPEIDGTPGYDQYHGDTELIVSLIDEDGKCVHIEMYESAESAEIDLAVQLDLDEARQLHAALTAILKQAQASTTRP